MAGAPAYELSIIFDPAKRRGMETRVYSSNAGAFLLPPNPMERHGMDTALLPRQRGKAALYWC